ncbi:peptide chain release factor N(5)-glutamine methyltransferase [Inquilinus sp. Marseille-Q2685]|uniref:peptide chain release factor N(5)-glutamine methyltransferase n=1 Tax=Inquilinus sp. Marseille-Q2685 TaxID=2866581 RepID=UPI001CE44707|nr:peptide chain release factor N(5)-glutamine methyltransferase [Inquilinus sp. Marseille-Q2685]
MTPRAPKIAEALRDGTARLAAAGIDSALSDARLLLMHALGCDRTGLLSRAAEAMPAEAAARYAGYMARREAREPVSRILGRREFWSLDFALGPATLDPRPDSETLVEAALAAVPDRPPSDRPLRVLDLGTGTGCLLLAVLHERAAAFGIGVDRSEAAARTARDNARALGLADRASFLVGDWAAALAGRFDLVLSNPPYIPDADIAALDPEVREHEPLLALSGGADGLDAYRALAAALPDLLARGGTAVVELGIGQAADVAGLFRAAGLDIVGTPPDLAGIPRCVVVKKAFGPTADCR